MLSNTNGKIDTRTIAIDADSFYQNLSNQECIRIFICWNWHLSIWRGFSVLPCCLGHAIGIVFWLNLRSMKRTCWTTGSWRCYLSLGEADSIPAWSMITLRWRHNGHDGVSIHQPRDCLLNRLFRCRSKKTWKLRGTGLCVGNSPGTDEFPAQMASNVENVSIWWRHHDLLVPKWFICVSLW